MAQSGGNFEVKISGNGTATLNDVRLCSDDMSRYGRDPASWIFDAGVKYNLTRFLLPDHPLFRNLTGCARQYVSSPDHLLVLYGSGWVCPDTVRAVFGRAGPLRSCCTTSLLTLALALIVGDAARRPLA